MREKEFFTRSINLDISVATIGLNKEDWYCYKPGMKRQDVIKNMLFKKYDIVPILNKHGTINSYFTINQLDNSKLEVNIIKPVDRLYYLTQIMDAVWRMNKSKKTYFFLSNGHDENDIVGLLSLSNYNSREFYIYLFGLISYVEREFAALIESDKTKGFEILEKMSDTEETKEQFRTIQGRYNEDEKNGNDNDYREYLYLFHLKCLIIDEQKFKELGYKNRHDFESGLGKIKDLRNKIAHPVKSIVRNLNDLNNLEIGMNKLYELKERLEKHVVNGSKITKMNS